jgi:hypothetical protein
VIFGHNPSQSDLTIMCFSPIKGALQAVTAFAERLLQADGAQARELHA